MSAPKFEAWGVVEVMGHNRAAGRITEEQLAGATMLRVDIPEGDGFRTVYYGSSAIFGVHVTDEERARAAAARTSPPAWAWGINRPQLAAPADDDPIGDDEYDADTGGQHDDEPDDEDPSEGKMF